MKLIKLLPIAVLLPSVGTITPFIASCGCSPEEIELKNEGTIMEYPYIQSDEVSVEAGKKYNIKITMQDWKTFVSLETPNSDWLFGFGNLNTTTLIESSGASIDASSKDNHVYINDKETNIDSIKERDFLQFKCLEIKDDLISKDDVVTLSLVFEESFEKGRFFMMWTA